MEANTARTCVITGAASGIGAAVAEALVAAGWSVVGIDLQDAGPDGVERIIGDAADPGVLARALDRASAGGRGLEGLVCAAGIPPSGPWDDRSHWADVIRVDLTAAYEALRLAMPKLAMSGGSAVLIGSISGGREGSSRSPAYAAAKAGLEGLARSFAVIGAGDGVRVNVVAPGTIDTPFDQAAFPPDRRPDVPLGRMGTPAEVASVVRYLLSDQASYVTGAVWTVDGGRTVLSPASAVQRSR